MKIDTQIEKIVRFQHLELIANQVVEGFISGMHKSPFHGFSAEFSEHKIHNPGESTKYIDWRLFAKTNRFYTKVYEEETNLRCHLIIDNSSSMYYPKLGKDQFFYENKIGFSVLASAVLMNLLKKQRDAVGLSVYSNQYEFYAPEKSSTQHYRMLLEVLENLLIVQKETKTTETIQFLHQIAKKIHRRSMIILFTDMFQIGEEEAFFNALQHLKHNKHKVILFHVIDKEKELYFNFDNIPKQFIDMETGDTINLFAENIKESYKKSVETYFKKLILISGRYKIKYIPISVGDNFEKIMTTYLTEKNVFFV